VSGHGSHSGIMRHRTDGEPVCDACRVFRNAYQKQRRAARRASEYRPPDGFPMVPVGAVDLRAPDTLTLAEWRAAQAIA